MSDSTTALWWIKSEPRKFRPFVANRVAEILSESDPIQWHHIGTKLNIADIASRGTAAADISADSTCIQGPEFLKSEFSEWPVDKFAVDFPEPSQVELKKSVLKTKVAPLKPVIDPAAYSSWIKLTQITTWIFHMCHNLCNKGKQVSGPLTVDELDNANLYWIRWGQSDRFQVEIEALTKGRLVPRDSRIAGLDPQLVDGVLRVGGRIEKAEIPWESKHPVILDHGHDITRLIVIHYHRKLIHAGVEHVFNHVREKYWILHGRAEVKNCTVKCPLCFRRRVKPMTQKMANLPKVPLAGASVPFQHVGIDYAGPFETRIGRN